MFGKFQQCYLRIEVEAPLKVIAESLLQTDKIRQWLLLGQWSHELPMNLHPGLVFTNWVGVIPIEHKVDCVNENCLRMLLSQGIDGYHEWYWGDGWIQSRLEGISLLPLNLGHTLSLLTLRDFVTRRHREIENQNFG